VNHPGYFPPSGQALTGPIRHPGCQQFALISRFRTHRLLPAFSRSMTPWQYAPPLNNRLSILQQETVLFQAQFQSLFYPHIPIKHFYSAFFCLRL
jgi:hypothetical protein